MRTLDVWLYGGVAGRLERIDATQLRYAYTNEWVDTDGVPLSRSLPVRHTHFEGAVVHSFFSNLLPEGDARAQLARRYGISVGDDFALLEAIGGDCAGAISLLPPDATPPETVLDDVRWLGEHELAEAIDALPRRPLLTDPDEGIRLSLAGAQDKFPVVVRGDRIGLPIGRTPSTHILKTPIARLEDTVANEAYCLAFAAELGLTTARATIGRAERREFLLVERYDRTHSGESVERLHQEDFCQALGVPPERKYEADGGPGAADCFDLIRSAVQTPTADILRLVDAFAFNLLVGNHDAHGKNFSLLHTVEATRLAPLYDLVSTPAYPDLSRKLAMKLGGEYRPGYVRHRHVERFARDAGLGPAAARRRIAGLARRAPEAAARIADDFEGRPIVRRVVAIVEERAGLLERELAGPSAIDPR